MNWQRTYDLQLLVSKTAWNTNTRQNQYLITWIITSSTVFKPKSMGENLAIPVVGVGHVAGLAVSGVLLGSA